MDQTGRLSDAVRHVPTRTRDIPLAGDKGVAVVDEADAKLVEGYSWYRHSNGHGGSYARGYVRGSGRGGRRIYMHQLLAGYGTDHENGDGLDNRRRNLRGATPPQQAANTRSRPGTSHYKGIYWHAITGKWAATITVKGRGRHLGLFINETDAARAYDAAALETWGEFARLNLPLEGR